MKPSEREAWAEKVAEIEAKQRGSPVHNPSGVPIGDLRKSASSSPISWPGTTAAAPKIGRVKGAQAVVIDGIKFSSRLEGDHYSELKLLQCAGQVEYFLRQVPFVVATGVVYRLDFLVVWKLSGTPAEVITYHETKGHLTGEARIKIAAVQDRYRIQIKILKRRDVRRS